MTLTTINQAANDPELLNRITSSVWKETLANPEFGDTDYGRRVIAGTAPITMTFAYPVAVDTEAAYEFAVGNNNPSPGGDPGVITDADISTAVQVHWPPDEEVTP